MGTNRKLLERYVERYNAGDLDAVMELYAEDAVQLMPEVRDGKIVVDNLCYDNMAVLAQLGLLPQGAAA